MYVSLPPDPLEIEVLRGRGLSRRQVKALITIGQVWTAPDGTGWTVAAVYRQGRGAVRLEPRGRDWTLDARFPTFAELGRHYRPEET